MDEFDRIERRCHRLAEVVNINVGDDIALLRDARVLKGIHAKLSLALLRRVRAIGRSDETVRAQSALDSMEQDLRRVLLDYSYLRRPQLHEHLTNVVTQSLEALDLIETPIGSISG